jgi:hypothetical protein
MKRLFAAALLALAACPIPQPLPVVQRVDGATVTPPRILAETATPTSGMVIVGNTCPPESAVRFDVDIEDPDLDDTVEARWFVDYAPTAEGSEFLSEFPIADPNGEDPRRELSGFTFPLAAGPSGRHHLVELVVSNGFYPVFSEPPALPMPHRTPQPGFETQVFRWTIVYDAAAACP